jgi:hypothetical protein
MEKSMTEITIHRCTSLRLVRTFVSNGNNVTLGIIDSNGGKTEIVLYNLPPEVTEKLNVLRDAETEDFDDERVPDPEIEAPVSPPNSDAAQGE